MNNFVHEMLHNSPAAQNMQKLWKACLCKLSYSSSLTPLAYRSSKKGKPTRHDSSKARTFPFQPMLRTDEDLMVHLDLDRFEMALQGNSSTTG